MSVQTENKTIGSNSFNTLHISERKAPEKTLLKTSEVKTKKDQYTALEEPLSFAPLQASQSIQEKESPKIAKKKASKPNEIKHNYPELDPQKNEVEPLKPFIFPTAKKTPERYVLVIDNFLGKGINGIKLSKNTDPVSHGFLTAKGVEANLGDANIGILGLNVGSPEGQLKNEDLIASLEMVSKLKVPVDGINLSIGMDLPTPLLFRLCGLTNPSPENLQKNKAFIRKTIRDAQKSSTLSAEAKKIFEPINRILEAIESSAREGIDFYISSGNGGPNKVNILSLAEEPPLSNKIHIVGALYHEGGKAYYSTDGLATEYREPSTNGARFVKDKDKDGKTKLDVNGDGIGDISINESKPNKILMDLVLQPLSSVLATKEDEKALSEMVQKGQLKKLPESLSAKLFKPQTLFTLGIIPSDETANTLIKEGALVDVTGNWAFKLDQQGIITGYEAVIYKAPGTSFSAPVSTGKTEAEQFFKDKKTPNQPITA